ncbi:hypothetical protein J2Y69_000624 [Microbacterium resistens]|uniref:DUF2017 domain-containing protein n=1 Tax=Microbacterium resistens TaxID=156977 RepID=A0ABU1S8W0_9MICO|nr:DUF2017 family protein [Microbacterium resistens]MDR6866039.1 hypothetical protein [Microbacterium resistens]
MNDRIVLLPLARIEGRHLADLIEQFLGLLADPDADAEVDPGLRRLTPVVYPDDAEASAEFARATSDDLLDRRAADARIVRAGLQRFVDGSGDDGDPLDVVIADADLDAWLRTLNALRLIIASRLGIESDTDHDAEDPRFGVYDWLGYRLDGLIEAAESPDRD